VNGSCRTTIPDTTVTLLYADGGTRKDYLTLQLAVARALRREWIGLDVKEGRTLVLSDEDDLDEMHRRLDSILKFYAEPPVGAGRK
jgi:RecA-family ATPase